MSNDHPGRFAIIPVFPSTDTKEAICIGDYKEVMAYIPQSVARDDAMRELDKARLTHDQIAHAQERTRAVQVCAFADSVKQLTRRLDSYEAEQLEKLIREREEAERAEAKRTQDALDALPDPDDPHAFASIPTKIRDDEPPASLVSKEPDPPFDLQSAPGKEPEQKGHVYPQPTAISLNEE
jgi:hypothetical protein